MILPLEKDTTITVILSRESKTDTFFDFEFIPLNLTNKNDVPIYIEFKLPEFMKIPYD